MATKTKTMETETAETKTMETETAETETVDLVDIFIERPSGNDEPNLMVGINGVNYLLPKGKISKVPRAVYDEIMRSRRAQATADEAIDGMREAAKQPK